MIIYSCEITGSGVALDAYLNDVHLYSSSGANHSFSTSLRPWMEEKNLFRIKISKSLEAEKDAPVQFKVLATATDGASSRTLASMRFPAGIVSPIPPVPPFDTLGKTLAEGHSLDFVCDRAEIIGKPWKAERRPIPSPASVYDLFARIQQYFIEGNVEQIMNISQERISFASKFTGMKREDFEMMVRNDLVSTLAKKPEWKIIKQPERELTLYEYVPNKLVRVSDLRGNTPLRTVAAKDRSYFGYEINVAMTPIGLVWIM